jgi:hypothetical protein
MTGRESGTARELPRELADASWLEWGALDHSVDFPEITRFLYLSAYAEGRQPHGYRVALGRVRKGEWRLPDGAKVLRENRTRNQRALYAAGEGWSLFVHRYNPGHGGVSVSAVSMELAKQIAEQTANLVRKKVKQRDDRVKLGFWHATGGGAVNQERSIEAPEWAEVRGNYPGAAAEQLDRLMKTGPDAVNGKLVLLHGPPGTGKTTALRALGRAWASWCRTDCVLDPERLFADPGYLLEVVMGEDEDERRWRLLILEDCDELIRGEAKSTAGQALSRLLNLTDGLLGQGQNILIAITTNEPLARLHPAVVRPGRCLAQIEVGPLSAAEAQAWLGTSRSVPGPMTLAALYARRAGRGEPGTAAPEPSTGMYI